ncbi:hypothetical protein VMCG_07749 [Cytospora schulzeri]|uniref:Uncharacterized protein n=1 Tax=Cytospora schulzeri TaxID=448051 RepID=A0A423W005_9PEZI|nr:hypothetical protein VMCG_07749 [Valsa malicola]
MASSGRSTSPTSSGCPAPPETTTQERIMIREIFAAEFGGAYIEAINVKTPVLFSALTTKRLDDPIPENTGDDNDDDNGHPFRSEVLKNTTDLLQRFHLAAPTFPHLGGTGEGPGSNDAAVPVPENMKTNVHALFWRATFCRYFCDDIEGLAEDGKVWSDVRRFVVALKMIWENDPEGGREVPARARLIAVAGMYGKPRPARRRGRVNALLWELMGRASAGLKEGVRHRDMETWCVEVTARVGLWRKLFRECRDLILRVPISEDTRAYPKDVLPEYSEDAMRLFNELIKALPVRYDDVDDESILMDISPEEDIQQHLHSTENATGIGMDGMVEDEPADVMTLDGQPSWSMRPPYAYDATREEPVNHFLSVVGRILDANKIPLN